MTKYLYGANVKAVQQFIFQTNKLKEIIGASELVEQICSSLFENQVGTSYKLDNCIISAAGIIKYIFEDEMECKNLVRVFPKVVLGTAPGIVFNQAVVRMTGDQPTGEELKELEQHLKTQRNKAIPPLETGLRITERSRRTGLPAIKYENNEPLDKATLLKKHAKTDGVGSLSQKLTGKNITFLFPEDIKEIASENNYIAIIHADGNNLGKAIRDLNENQKNPVSSAQESSIKLNKKFSQAIEKASLSAARIALEKTFADIIAKTNEKGGKKTMTLPMRPVIIGGDDFTVICNAAHALELTTIFLTEFEKKSAEAFKSEGLNLPALTACAGIAYIKPNYPFHYGAKLAEDLCSFSKKAAKQKNQNRVPACLTFHRVQSSFIGEYEDIVVHELTAPEAGLSFCGGPYFVSNTQPAIDALIKQAENLADKDVPASKIRNWFSTCHFNRYTAIEDMIRIIKVLRDKGKEPTIKVLNLEELLSKIENKINDEIIRTTLYDAMTIHSLNAKD